MATARLRLSKRSCVTLRVLRAGRAVHERTLVLPGGVHALRWRPARAGRHEVRVEARDLVGHRTRTSAVLRVRG